MERDFISKKEAEKIVFRKQYEQEEEMKIEEELLEEGDGAAVWDD